ncbi:MAG: hypothetical protein IJO06_06000 [Thermoguttaceae bacterium]|nr:hypothetical protein [Thermoguttaceae bacterium]
MSEKNERARRSGTGDALSVINNKGDAFGTAYNINGEQRRTTANNGEQRRTTANVGCETPRRVGK